MIYEDVKHFLKTNKFLEEDDLPIVEISFNKNDLNIDYLIDIYKTKRIVAIHNDRIDKRVLDFMEDLIENLSTEEKDVKIRLVTVKGSKAFNIFTNNQLSKTYGVLYL
ncbi:hypothetical protein AAEO56_15995 [Flavobacterium sp. DGU11]|uniref:Uncharacterized protein n=1 Tax=Flavobacterium arundinis TaxID=3139143 RepID=A0ABU9I022_9FLAO